SAGWPPNVAGPIGVGTAAIENWSTYVPEKYWFMLNSAPPSGVALREPISWLPQLLSTRLKMELKFDGLSGGFQKLSCTRGTATRPPEWMPTPIVGSVTMGPQLPLSPGANVAEQPGKQLPAPQAPHVPEPAGHVSFHV